MIADGRRSVRGAGLDGQKSGKLWGLSNADFCGRAQRWGPFVDDGTTAEGCGGQQSSGARVFHACQFCGCELNPKEPLSEGGLSLPTSTA